MKEKYSTQQGAPRRAAVFSVQPPFFMHQRGDFNMKRILLVGRRLKSFSTRKKVSPPRCGEIHNELLVVKQCVLLLVVLVVIIGIELTYHI